MREHSTDWPMPMGTEKEIGWATPFLLLVPVLLLAALAAFAFLTEPFFGGLG